jgi:hypothetical protein
VLFGAADGCIRGGVGLSQLSLSNSIIYIIYIIYDEQGLPAKAFSVTNFARSRPKGGMFD